MKSSDKGKQKFHIIMEPTEELFTCWIECFNENLRNGRFPHLARDREISLDEAAVWMRRYKDGKNLVAIAVVNNKVAGEGVIRILPGRKCHNGVISVSVDCRHRHMGVGKALFENLIKQAKQRGMKRIESEPAMTNIVAINLETKLGFKKEAILREKLRVGENEYVDCAYMVLYLNHGFKNCFENPSSQKNPIL